MKIAIRILSVLCVIAWVAAIIYQAIIFVRGAGYAWEDGEKKALTNVSVSEFELSCMTNIQTWFVTNSYLKNTNYTNDFKWDEWSLMIANGTNRPVAVTQIVDHGMRMKEYPIVYDLTNYVNELVTTGEFCRIRGHVWHYGEGDSSFYGTTFENGWRNRRKCPVCGRIETRSNPSWPTP
jgi:hypothetical protein